MLVLQPTQIASATTPAPVETGKHWPALDGLRGIAILLVFVSHFSGGHKSGNVIVRLLAAIMDSGWMGVDLFFVLSGFLITGILFDTAQSENRARNFYARRALRIFPLFYAVLFGFLLLTPVLHLHWHPENFLFFVYLSNMIPILAPHFRPPGVGVDLLHLWSLAVEEQFYLLWPFVVWSVRDRRALLRISVCIMAGAFVLRILLLGLGVSSSLIYQLLFTRADSLICGGALALLVRGPAAKILPVRWVLPIAAFTVLGSFLLSGSGQHESSTMMTVGFTAIAIFSACLVYCAQQGRGWIARVANHSFLRFWGRYSYGLYIFHGVLLVFLIPLLPSIQLLAHSAALGGLLYVAFALLLSLGMAMLSYHYFEAPILRLKRRFSS